MTLRYYVSGPMRGIPEYNFPAFDHAAAWLRSQGIEAINPADHDRELEPDIESKLHFIKGDASLNTDGPKFEQLIRWDLEQISDPACTGIVLLAGWEASKGAAIELAKARELGKEVWLLQRQGDGYAWGYTSKAPDLVRSLMAADVPLRRRVEGDDIEALERLGDDYFVKVESALREPRTPHDLGQSALDRDAAEPSEGPMWAAGYNGKDPAIGLGHQFETKDSGVRVAFESGMVRDTDEGKPRYDLIPLAPLKRLAELYARGAVKYGDRNWQKANSAEELARFKASAFRHFVAWLDGDLTEDHAIGTVWNIFAALWLEEKLVQHNRPAMTVDEARADVRERLAHGGVQHG